MPASISPTTLGWRNLVNRYPSNCARPTSNKRISRIEVKSEFDIRGAALHRVGCGKRPRVWRELGQSREVGKGQNYLFGSGIVFFCFSIQPCWAFRDRTLATEGGHSTHGASAWNGWLRALPTRLPME